MAVARHNVAELWGLRQATGGPASAGALAARSEEPTDLVEWVERSPLGARKLVGGGLALAIAGALGALLIPGVGFFGTVALGSMFTAGGGLAFLGLRKLAKGSPGGAAASTGPAMLPPSRQQLMTERARRMRAVLERGPSTFERITATLRWTESAVLETLVFMKDAGVVIEDLDLDTGEWIYRLQDNDFGTTGTMTLADRQALAGDPERIR
jgi:hypothetical protein